MYDLILSNSGKSEIIIKDVMTFKKENGVFHIRNKDGVEKIIRGSVKEITDSAIILEGSKARSVVSCLAPLNF